MPNPLRHPRAAVAALSVLALLTGGAAATTASAAPADRPGRASASRSEAVAALHAARAALSPRAPATTGPSGRDATMALLQLARTRSALTGADAAAAAALVARPDWDTGVCTPDTCYHWKTSGPDAIALTDSNSNSVPDYVESVADAVEHVRSVYIDAGYRPTEPDAGIEGGNLTDIYLADTGAEGAYGYCTTDKQIPGSGPYDAWAFCVLDNDFSPDQFGTRNTPLENLQVTAAHEYFHAVQFAYDVAEDAWFMEATATWAEDELYDDVNDNIQYLTTSPLTAPGRPLDTWADSGAAQYAQYGEWIYFRYLTEHYGTAVGGLPTLVRDMWRRADGAAGGRDEYSIQSVRNTLATRGISFDKTFGAFAAANRLPRTFYDEGAANAYPSVPPSATFRLTRSRKDSGWKSATLRHLSAVTDRFVPSTGLSSTVWKLRVSVNLPSSSTHPAAVVTVVKRSGAPSVSVVSLNGKGDATKTVPFGSKGVKYVEVTLANAGTSYSCWSGGAYSCQGSSKDDGRKVLVRAVAVR